jgi:hypothetical protein
MRIKMAQTEHKSRMINGKYPAKTVLQRLIVSEVLYLGYLNLNLWRNVIACTAVKLLPVG